MLKIGTRDSSPRIVYSGQYHIANNSWNGAALGCPGFWFMQLFLLDVSRFWGIIWGSVSLKLIENNEDLGHNEFGNCSFVAQIKRKFFEKQSKEVYYM